MHCAACLLLLPTVRLEVLVSAQAWLSVSAFRITVIVARLHFSLLSLLQHSFPSGAQSARLLKFGCVHIMVAVASLKQAALCRKFQSRTA